MSSRILIIEDEEANKKSIFGEKKEIKAYIYPATGQVQAEQWGKELPYIFNLLTNFFKDIGIISTT